MSKPEPGVEEIAKEIATKYAPSFYRGALSLDIVSALRARDERAAKIVDERGRELGRMAIAPLLAHETVMRFKSQSDVCRELTKTLGRQRRLSNGE